MSIMNGWNRTTTRTLLALLAGATLAWAQEVPAPAGPSLLVSAESEVRREAEAAPAASAAAGQPTTARRVDLGDTIPKPRLSGSTTGYVENAFIGSQVRVRFDAGFEVDTPDRAEFFYAKCGCYRLAGIDPDAAGPVPPFAGGDPTNVPLIENSIDYRDFQMYGEYAPTERFSVFVDVPLRSISPSIIPNATGFGDMRAGVRLGLLATDQRALTFQFKTFFPTGNAGKGLGTDHTSLDFSLLYNDTFERLSVGGEFGTWNPIGGASATPVSADDDFAGNVVRYGFGIGVDLVSGPAFSFAPVVEVVGWHLLGGYASVTPDGTPGQLTIPSMEGVNIVNLKVGGRFTFNGRNSIYVGYGLPMTDAWWYDDVLRLEYRYAF